MARQLVSHGHVTVDGRRVDIASFLVEPGQTVALTDAAREIPVVIEEIDVKRPLPDWLARGGEASGTVQRLPERGEIDVPVNEAQIVGFYSR
jgi:small subunit ribosomal protein S4